MSRLRRTAALLSMLGATALLMWPRRAPLPGAPSPSPHPSTGPASGRESALSGRARGEPGIGGFYGTWPEGSEDAAVAGHIEFQYSGMAHQSETAMAGMWLFLATELLFFGGLFLLYMVYRVLNAHAFAVASRHTELGFGTINTVLLLTSSAVFAWGLGQVRLGHNRNLARACAAVAALGTAFLCLKGFEWLDDLHKNLFPGPSFAIAGADGPGAQLFWFFYFVATGLHGIHMIVGIGLVAWVGFAAWRGRYSPGYFTPVEVIGLYWSFVDMVWLCLYPMIYLAGGVTR